MTLRLPALLPILLIALLPPAAAAAGAGFTEPAPFAATYAVRLNNLPFKARAYQSLTRLGNQRWRLELKVESFLLDTVETSEFRWDPATCRAIPEHYHYSRSGIGRDSTLDMRFNMNTRVATRNDGKATTTFAVTAATEDKLGHTLGLACRIARGARGNVGVEVAWDKDVRHFDYRVAANEETVVTPSGNWRAIRFERQRTDSDRVTTSWIAAAAGWQAVQMQHTEGDGRLFQLQLLELDRAP